MAQRMSLGAQQLASVITRKKLSLEQVGDAIGVSRQSVHYYLEGMTQPRRDVMIRLRDLYGIKADAWLEDARKTG